MSSVREWLLLTGNAAAMAAAIISAWHAWQAKLLTEVAKVEQGDIAKKLDTVEVNTNSRVDRQDALIKTLGDQVAALTAQLAKQEQLFTVQALTSRGQQQRER